MSSLRDEKNQIALRLRGAGVEPPEAACEAELIIAHVSGYSLAQQLLHADEPLEQPLLAQVEKLLADREKRIPLQYCLGYGWFMGLKFAVKPGVFIPRTDTETLVQVCQHRFGSGLRRRHLPVGEIGIGSGAISVALLKEDPDLKIVACDINRLALEVTAVNARTYGVFDRLDLIHGDWRQVLPANLQAVISNPPYIARGQKSQLQAEVGEHEPESALFGDDPDGLGFYRAIAAGARKLLRGGEGFVAVEVGDGQAEAVCALLSLNGWLRCTVDRDVNGLTRVVSADAR